VIFVGKSYFKRSLKLNLFLVAFLVPPLMQFTLAVALHVTWLVTSVGRHITCFTVAKLLVQNGTAFT